LKNSKGKRFQRIYHPPPRSKGFGDGPLDIMNMVEAEIYDVRKICFDSLPDIAKRKLIAREELILRSIEGNK